MWCSFRIACDRNFARQGEQRQADFIDIVAWRQQAEFVSKYFQKGSLIAIEGSLCRPASIRIRTETTVPLWRSLPTTSALQAPNRMATIKAAAAIRTLLRPTRTQAPARPAAVEAAPSYSVRQCR